MKQDRTIVAYDRKIKWQLYTENVNFYKQHTSGHISNAKSTTNISYISRSRFYLRNFRVLPVKSDERVVVIRSEGSAWRCWSDWYCRRHGTCWTEGQERSARSYRCLRTARFWIRPAWTQRTTRTCRSNWPRWIYRCSLLELADCFVFLSPS